MEPDSTLTVDAVFALTLDAQGRVQLRGKYWDGLYKLLPAASDGRKPPNPLILGGDIPDDHEGKRERMREHIEWAAAHGVLELVKDYLITLTRTTRSGS
jgi:hypothetical protein